MLEDFPSVAPHVKSSDYEYEYTHSYNSSYKTDTHLLFYFFDLALLSGSWVCLFEIVASNLEF